MAEETLNTLTKEDVTRIRSLRSRGFAVIVWTPRELEDSDMDAQAMEDRSIEFGNEMLENAGG